MSVEKTKNGFPFSIPESNLRRTPVSLAILASLSFSGIESVHAANECTAGISPTVNSTVSCSSGTYLNGILYATTGTSLVISDSTIAPFIQNGGGEYGNVETTIGAASRVSASGSTVAIDTSSSNGTASVVISKNTLSSQEAHTINTSGQGLARTQVSDSIINTDPTVSHKWGIYNHAKEGNAIIDVESSTFNYTYAGTEGGTGGAFTNFLDSGNGIAQINSRNNHFNMRMDSSDSVISAIESNTRFATDNSIDDTGSVFTIEAPLGQGRAIFLHSQTGGNGSLALTDTTITGTAKDIIGALVSTTGGNGNASGVAKNATVSLTSSPTSTSSRAVSILASDAGTSTLEVTDSAFTMSGGNDTRTVQVGVIGRTADYLPVSEGGNGLSVGKTTLKVTNSSVKVVSESGKAIEAVADGEFQLTAASTSKIDAASSLHGSAIFVAGEYTGNGSRRLSGDTDINIGAETHVSGGWTDGSTPVQANNTATAINLGTTGNAKIINEGTLDASSDSIINTQGNRANKTALSSFSLTNAGSMTGSIDVYDTLNNADVDNTGTWTLRNLTDTNGDGVRDTFGVSSSTLGLSNQGSISNSGTIALEGDNGLATGLNNTGEYRTGYAANAMALGGAAQAQLLGVKSFSNSGIINMGNGKAGDVLLVSGGQTPGVSGGGVYIANGGLLTLDTVLNEGGAGNASDMLVVDGTRLGSEATGIKINNVGGTGAKITSDGIEVVRVLDSAQSADGVFTLNGRAVAGAYEYNLYHGGVGSHAADGNWYLRSQLINPEPIPDPTPDPVPDPDQDPSSEPVPDPTPAPAPTSEKVIRPEAGSYAANMAAASKMFNQRLIDREGRAENSSMWLRQKGNRNTFSDESGQVKTAINTYVVQGGGEIASMQFGDKDRLGVGVMLGYGSASSDSHNSHMKYRSKGSVNGYSGGLYATWYQDAASLDGTYIDSWVQYSKLDASVKGDLLTAEYYDIKGWSASLEGGYRIALHESENTRVFLTPQAQMIWNGAKADEHREANGTRVTSSGHNNLQSRLGVRLAQEGVSSKDKGSDKLFTLFSEANWLHNTEQTGATLDGMTTRQAGTTNIGELKVGVHGQLNKNSSVWTQFAQQMGGDGYSDSAVTIGLKYQF